MSNYAYTPNQTKAITYLHGNVRVIAGAGSGKTKVLVKRYLYILGDDYADDALNPEYIVNKLPALGKPDIKAAEILAITFTEKAGKEMSERIYARLSQLVDTTTDKEYWQKCTADLATAHVGTMHSLYSKIIRENPVEAQIDPNFTLLSSLNEEYEQKTFNNAYINKLLKGFDPDFALLYDSYSLTQLTELLAFVLRNSVNLPANYEAFAAAFAGNLDNDVDLAGAVAEFRELLIETFSTANLAELRKKTSKSNTALLMLSECREIFSTDQDTAAYLSVLKANSTLLSQVFATLRTNSKIGGELKKAYQQLQETLIFDALSCKAAELLPPLTRLLFAYLTAWRQHKQEQNLLTFDDTEKLCLQLLGNYPEILSKYQMRYKHVLIDEVQDLSDIQHEIISLLTSGAHTVLFSVGDKKQSIYGFRGSSIHTDTAALETISLDTNFRSQAGIIHTCNEFFHNYTQYKSSNVHFDSLQAHRPSEASNVFTAFYEKDDPNELDNLSRYILELWQAQGVQPEDMAILVRTNGQTENICRYLEKYRIPYRVSGRGGFFQDQYILDLLNLLSCINNKYAQIELLAVLRSPFFAIADQSITDLYSCSSNLWEALANIECRTPNAQSTLLERAYNTLSQLSVQSRYLTISQLLREILYTYNWQNIMLTQADALQNLANLNKFVELVASFEEEHSPYLPEFIEYITTLRSELGSEEMPNVTDSSQLGVNIMSIHKSKGLEFSYVFLPQLQKISTASKGGNRLHQFDSQLLQIGLKFPLEQNGKYESSQLFNSIKKKNQELDEHESLRILYVAMTRARDYLILSGTRTSGKDSSLNNALEWLMNFLPNSCVALDFSALSASATNIEAQGGELPTAEYEQALANCTNLSSNTKTLERLSASALHDYQLCPLLFKYKYLLELPDLAAAPETDSSGIGENSTILGTLVHKLLEDSAMGRASNLQELLPVDMPDTERERLLQRSRELVGRYQNSKLYKSNKDYLLSHEYPFSLYDRELGVLLTGIVDCVLLLPDNTLGIIDYKTGRQLDKYLDFYKLQLCLYAKVLQQVFRKQVSYLAIHHIAESINEISISTAEYQAGLQQLQELVATIKDASSSDSLPAQTEHCTLCSFAYLCAQAQ